MLSAKMTHLVHQGISSYRNILSRLCGSFPQLGIARGASYQRRRESSKDSKKHHEQINEAEEVEDFFNQLGPSYVEDFVSKEVKRQKTLKFKIIQKKYFREKPEANLLTWDAKEQIRYLHQEFPEEWTIERLAESFPISIAGVRRLLKSMWYPMTLAEVVKHDTRVQKQWKLLKSESHQDGGPVLTRYQNLLQGGKLKNAAGVAFLPAPARRDLLMDGSSPMSLADRTEPGPFEKIVKDYCEKKQQEKDRYEKQAELVDEKLVKLKEDSLRVLCDVTKNVQARRLNPGLEDPIASQQVPVGQARLKANKETHKPRNLHQSMLDAVPSSQSLTFGEGSAILEGLDDISGFSEAPVPAGPMTPSDGHQPPSPRKGLRRKALSASISSETLQMHGTGKLLPESHDDPDISSEDTRGFAIVDKGDDYECTLPQTTTPRMRRHPEGEESRIWEELRYDTPVDYSDDPEAYLYSEQRGYQHPLGKKDRELDKVKIPHQQKAQGRLYKKGNSFYDEDGNLLYRVP